MECYKVLVCCTKRTRVHSNTFCFEMHVCDFAQDRESIETMCCAGKHWKKVE